MENILNVNEATISDYLKFVLNQIKYMRLLMIRYMN